MPVLYFIKMVKPQLDVYNYPFDPDWVLTIDIKLPPSGKFLRPSIVYSAIFTVP